MEAKHPSGQAAPALVSPAGHPMSAGQARFELDGLEELQKVVTRSGKSGRVYLPTPWCGKLVKIIRLD